jgi:Fe-S oxidoreductase
MKLPRAEVVSRRCVLFEQFIDNLLCKEPDALRFKTPPTLLRIFIHAHCHIRALSQPSFIKQMLQHLPGTEVKILETGCCGMAGAFGMMKSKYDLSLKIAQPLKDAISELPENSYVAVQGTSCRHQIEHVTSIIPKHPAEIMAEFLMP